MTELYAINFGDNKEYLLDTMGDENINITLSIDDIQDAGNKQTGYSKDFLLPFTKANNQFFEHYYSLDRYTVNFNPYKSINCRLVIDNIDVLDGFMNFMSVTKKGEDYFYKVVAYDSVANLFDQLEDLTLADLDYNDITHMRYTRNSINATINNVIQSWGGTGITKDNLGYQNGYIPSTQTTNVLYPLVTNDYFYYPYNGGNYSILDQVNCPLSLNLKYVVDKIFDKAGFSYESNFFTDEANSYFRKMYFDTTTQGSIQITEANNSNFSVNPVGNTGSTGYPVSVSTNINALTQQSYTFNQENDDNSFSSASQLYTAEYSGQLKIEQRFRIRKLGAANQGKYLYMYAVVTGNDNVYYNGTTLIDSAYINGQTYHSVVMTGYIPVTAGTTVAIKFRANTSGLQINNIEGQNQVNYNPHNQIRFRLAKVDYPDLSIPIRVGQIKLTDILKDLFKLFNLVSEKTDNINIIKIEPFQDFVATGEQLNWTEKCDFKNAKITPIINPSAITLNFADDQDDFYLNRHKELYDINYAQQTINFDSENENEVKIDLKVFAPAYTQQMQTGYLGSFMHIGKLNEGYVGGFANKPRLFFKNNTISDMPSGLIYVQEQSTWISNLTLDQYSTASHYETTAPSIVSDTETLSFGVVQNIYQPISGQTPAWKNTLYRKWYEDYFEERYNNDSGLLYEIKIDLTPQDIFNFSFKNTIKIEDQVYRVNKIKYNSDKNKLAIVELYRI